MGDAMSNIRNKLLGKSTAQPTGEAASSIDDPKVNPMLAGLMKTFGLSPDAIQQFAESMKAAIEGRLVSIDDKLERIMASNLTIEMKLAEIESNQRILLEKATDDNEAQFAQMAEAPLTEPML
jgi:hypothetical protein